MEASIFYWTGKIIWWLICVGVITCVLTAVTIAPLVTYSRVQKYMWKWKYTHDIATGKLTPDDLKFAAEVQGYKAKDILKHLEWVRRVKERADAILKVSGRTGEQ